jgi:hypothetical protein|uniref:Uncharacterized protein n=1 Tax=Mimiviridae sp. ChoanoV1 TaxID=2596887 RepID=A0A5B8HVR2_9VIRU|nr:hypothetical protein 1_98 [Mimiviridae sp. ChoanoV1]
MFNEIPISKILKFIVYILLIYFSLVFLMSKIKVDNIEIKNKNNLINFEEKYKLPKNNFRGKNLTKLEK